MKYDEEIEREIRPMTKYICSQCTGRSGEEHTFRLGEEPNTCPYNGCEKRHIKIIEEFLGYFDLDDD